MKLQLIDTASFPEWAVCYLYYGDPGDLTEQETQLVDQWVAEYAEVAEGLVFEPMDAAYFVKECWGFAELGGLCVVDVNVYGIEKKLS